MKKTSLPKKVIVLAIGCALAVTFALIKTDGHALQAPPDYAAIDAYIQKQMREWHIPGAAVLIVQDDQMAHLQSFGQADSKNPVTPQTPFEIGSCTKSFTALAVMQLVEQGKLDLDTPVQQYIPWFRAADADASAQITIRHLLNQSSGLSQENSNKATTANTGLTLEEQVRAIQKQPLTARPAAVYQYSNLNYMTLALVIEKVTGQSYGDYLQQKVFSPLKMENSFTDAAEARQHGFSGGHTWWFGLPLKSLEGPRPDMLGAGYIMTSPEDLSHYLVAQLNGGIYQNTSVLSAQGIETMHQPTQLADGESVYGMGWVNYEENGLTIVNHNGQSASYTCSMILIPEKRLGLAVLANVSSSLGPHAAWSLANNAKDMLLTGQPADVDSSYRDFYLPWSGGFLLATLALLWSMIEIPGERRNLLVNPPKSRAETFQRVTLPSGVDALLSLVAFIGLPLAQGYEIWRGLFVWQPDAVYWCLATGIVLALKAIGRVFLLKRGGRT